MTDENIIGYVHAFADKAMARDLAVLTDCCALLDLHEGAYFGIVIDAAAVGIHKVEYPYVFTDFHIFKTLLVCINIQYFHDFIS